MMKNKFELMKENLKRKLKRGQTLQELINSEI